ncbi:MAG: hypothetical protein HY290_24045 [Planctomycetia bacterium]|nr:hypothetical protein [Planctomycetia bacterium]
MHDPRDQRAMMRVRPAMACVLFVTAIVVCGFGFAARVLAHPTHESDGKSASSADAENGKSPSAAAIPKFPEVERLRRDAVKGEPLDEALGGKTLQGTPIWPRTAECFPAESRDLFWQMDRVPDGPGGVLRSLNFDRNNSGTLEDDERDAIRGRNTWILWGGGNEGFWNWLAQDGYGFMDFLVAFDSRNRGSRFKRLGVVNQPGFVSNADPAKRVLGLYLDLPDAAHGGPKMPPAPWDKHHSPAAAPADHRDFKLFEPGDADLLQRTRTALYAMHDGVDPAIYGYPTGVVGVRLFLNPDFFGNTSAASHARQYWQDRVEKTNDRFYTDPGISADPQLVRPFRVSMSCGFCHVGPHPLNPPSDPEAPRWENLSSIIGNQFWKPQPLFANRVAPGSFIYHFLASQQPGTIDTSLISTDHINNSNTINAVFEVNARLDRARLNPRERQSDANLRLPSIEDHLPGLTDPSQITERQRERHTARVLLDGSDSIGAFGALARVYLNIGSYYEEWNTCHNPIIGFRPQRPFALATCQRNSVYWQTNEKYRAPYLAAFFTLKHEPSTKPDEPATGAADVLPAAGIHSSTQAMHLSSARNAEGKLSVAAKTVLEIDSEDQRKEGRLVWLDHCAICHSSRQPDGFELSFADKPPGESWGSTAAPANAQFTLPFDSSDWEDFKRSPSYKSYRTRLYELVKREKPLDVDPLKDNHPFWIDNYLSTDIRVPLTLVGTNPARGLATNAIEAHVWDNFSSRTYKELTAVGALGFADVISGKSGSFNAPAGGRGYYRPATHVSLWSTAPFLHNNSMGLYLDDPSVKGRLVQFLDSIRRMLWFDRRASKSLVLSQTELAWLKDETTADTPASFDPNMVVTRPGDLRATDPRIAGADPGFVYRVPHETYFEIPVAYTRRLIEGVAGSLGTSILELWGWIVAVVALLVLAWLNRARYVGIGLVILVAVLVSLWVQSGVGGTSRATAKVVLMGFMDLLRFNPVTWWLLVLGLGGYGLLLILADPDSSRVVRWIVVPGALLLVVAVYLADGPAAITLIGCAIGAWIVWKREPTLAAFTRAMLILLALGTALLGYGANRFVNGKPLITVPVVNVTYGPFPVRLGPIPRGVPVNLIMNIDPESENFATAAATMTIAIADIRTKHLDGEAAYDAFIRRAGPHLIDASKCPDFQLDRGHLFGEALSDRDKNNLIAFLKTL